MLLLKSVFFGTPSATKRLRLLIKYYFGLGRSAPADIFAPSCRLLTDKLPAANACWSLSPRPTWRKREEVCKCTSWQGASTHNGRRQPLLSYILRWVNFTNACLTANSITWPTILPIIQFSSFSAETWMVFALYNLRHYRFFLSFLPKATCSCRQQSTFWDNGNLGWSYCFSNEAVVDEATYVGDESKRLGWKVKYGTVIVTFQGYTNV